jgi:ABC-type multidrug transport system fused ATPase/permease subunit
VEPVTVAVLGVVTVAVLGVVTVAVLGVATVAVLGVTVAVLGVVTVAVLGAVTVMGFTTAGVFSVRALASMASAIRGGGIIRIIPTIRIHPHTTAIPTMAACTMARRITVIRTTETVILARPPPRRSKPHSHDGATITVRLTVCGVRRLEMQFDRFRPIKAYR